MRNGYFRNVVEVDGDIDGQCLNGESLFMNHKQPPGSGCSKWVKWSALG
jgi:hypothetical protein